MGPTRTEEDFVNHIARTVASDPVVTRWHFVTDNLNIHQSAGLVRLVAKHDGITEDLGKKDNPTATSLFDIRVTAQYGAPAYPREQQEAAYVTSLSERW